MTKTHDDAVERVARSIRNEQIRLDREEIMPAKIPQEQTELTIKLWKEGKQCKEIVKALEKDLGFYIDNVALKSRIRKLQKKGVLAKRKVL